MNEIEGCPLTVREMDCLRLVADGNSAKLVAHKLSISRNTVIKLLGTAKIRCGYTGNVTGFCVNLIRKGWI